LIRFLTERPRHTRQEIPIQSVARLLVAAYLIEAGIVLVIAPWTQYWAHNYFGLLWPWLGNLMASAYVRGGVSGVGLITMAVGVRQLLAHMFARDSEPTMPTDSGAPSS
jgi:hypothetical protein